MPASYSSSDRSASPPPAGLEARNQSSFVIEELPPDDSSDEEWEDDPRPPWPVGSHEIFPPMIPTLYTALPALRDALVTKTSELQEETVQEILPYLTAQSGEFEWYNHHGIPRLDRARHIRFLHKSLQDLPAPYVAADAARPWFFYWALCGLSVLGEDVRCYRERLINTIRPMQNATGGFGSGHGQMSHLAPTYTVILSLSMVGGADALEVIDRKAMWRWLSILKQPDGGFQMSVGGEEDVRGTYCAVVILSLLDLPVDLSPGSPAKTHEADTLLTGIPEYVSRCQTYEGGISSRPNGEAHGAFTFCALACLCVLGDPHVVIPKYLDVASLASWLSARQYAPEGGFAGRTNKLVDGCYSHWVGASWPLVVAALDPPAYPFGTRKRRKTLFDREGLIRYTLCACQDRSRRGGMRDKPSKNSDGYHTCYVLSGLSATQHAWSFHPSSPPAADASLSGALASSYQWRNTVDADDFSAAAEVFDTADKVKTLHPIFVIPEGAPERTRMYFCRKGGFL